MSATNPLTAPLRPQVDAQASSVEAPATSPAAARHRKAHCGSCGQAWFGKVSYCPYCGQPSTGAPTHSARDPAADHQVARAHTRIPARKPMPQGADEQALATQAALSPALREPGGTASPLAAKDRWKPVVAVAAVLALFAIVVDQLSVTPRNSAPVQATASRAAPAPASRPTPPPVAAPVAAAATPSPTAKSGDTASSTQVMSAGALPPRADRDAPPQPPAAPAPPRSLCSAANAAAGLCTPR